MRQGRAKRQDKCWDKMAEVADIFFESHTRLRRELQLKLAGARVALERGDIESAKRIIRELQVLLDL